MVTANSHMTVAGEADSLRPLSAFLRMSRLRLNSNVTSMSDDVSSIGTTGSTRSVVEKVLEEEGCGGILNQEAIDAVERELFDVCRVSEDDLEELLQQIAAEERVAEVREGSRDVGVEPEEEVKGSIEDKSRTISDNDFTDRRHSFYPSLVSSVSLDSSLSSSSEPEDDSPSASSEHCQRRPRTVRETSV